MCIREQRCPGIVELDISKHKRNIKRVGNNNNKIIVKIIINVSGGMIL